MDHLFIQFFPIVLGSVLTSYLAWTLISRYSHLKSIPGPIAAAFSDLWLFRICLTKQHWRHVSADLHRKYGSVVRYGPNRVAFSDASAIHTIFGTTNLFEKVSLQNFGFHS